MTQDWDSRRIQFPVLPLNSSTSWMCDSCSILISMHLWAQKSPLGAKAVLHCMIVYCLMKHELEFSHVTSKLLIALFFF